MGRCSIATRLAVMHHGVLGPRRCYWGRSQGLLGSAVCVACTVVLFRPRRFAVARWAFGPRRTFFLPPAADFAFASFVFSAAMLCDGVELQPAQPTEGRCSGVWVWVAARIMGVRSLLVWVYSIIAVFWA